jgi:electron transfer flavoprotein beta subunit
MKILVAIKRVVDTETRVRIAPDGKSLDMAGVQTIVAPYDEMALEKAIQLKEAGKATQVTVITAGPAEAAKELRTCLAMGADDAIHVKGEFPGSAGATAEVLAAAIEGKGYDLLLCGKQATDHDDAAVGPMIAARLGLPCVGFVFGIEPLGDGKVRVQREVEGETEVLEVDLPCVLTAQKGLAEARYPGLKGIMAAKKKPLVEVTPAPATSRTTVRKLSLPPARAGLTKIEPTPEGMRTLLTALRNEKKVL